MVAKNSFEEDLFGCRNGDLIDDKEGTGARVVAFVSKMFAMPRERLPPLPKKSESAPSAGLEGAAAGLSLEDRLKQKAEGIDEATPTEEEQSEEVLLGFARLFSGTLATSSTPSSTQLYALLPKYNTSLPPSHPRNTPYLLGPLRVKALYEMMGRDLIRVESVKAGNVFAIEGLESVVGRSGTLCQVSREEVESGKPVERFVNLASVNNTVSSLFPFLNTDWLVFDLVSPAHS